MSKEVVDEIMEMVDSFALEAASVGIGSIVASEDAQEQLIKDAQSARKVIESKLHELVENKFSVKEPLSVQYPDEYENPFARIAYASGWRAAERAHEIGKEN